MSTDHLSAPGARLRVHRRNMILWTLQGWIALFFIAAGYAKLTEPVALLGLLLEWPALAPPAFVRGLGAVEITLALLLVAPLTLRRLGRPLLVAGAAGLAALEAVMGVMHLADRHWGHFVTNLILLAGTAAVLWFRATDAR